MRVISGAVRGKKLNSISELTTRPTLDRIKEALFNIIQFKIEDAVVLDLFAGSGSLGIEALSRNAELAVFCDNSYEAIKVIKQNLSNTKLEEKAQIIHKDYILALKKLSKDNFIFDIIFVDPPYKSDFAVKSIDEIMEKNILSNDGIIIIETDNKNLSEQILKDKKANIYDIRQYGKTIIIFVRKDGI
jgi:16S rRNA (guanine(966)-N(2))-methyltransferase RsmD